jgi:CheY-like chemotaxis protein/uncharacterized protein YbcI
MLTAEKTLRVLIVDDNRDGADTLGLLLEELGHQVHVTYGGRQALDVAAAFRADLMLVDLAMPDMDGCRLVTRFRLMPAFAQTKIVAITCHADEGHKTMALKAGFDAVLFKPINLTEIEAVLSEVVAAEVVPLPKFANKRRTNADQAGLAIGAARRLRNDRPSKTLTQAESEAAICEGIIRFQEEYMGWRSDAIQVHFVADLLVVRIIGALTLAERQLGKSLQPETGRDLVKQARKQLLELAGPMLESLVHEVTGVKVQSMHHDISTVTGEEVVVFSLVQSPKFGTSG